MGESTGLTVIVGTESLASSTAIASSVEMMKGGGHDGGTWSSPTGLGDRGECLSSTMVGPKRVFKRSGVMDPTCIMMVVDASGKDDAGGCGGDSMLGTMGGVGSGPWSAGGTSEEHTAGEGTQ